VPFADYILFRHATKNRVLLNIGGIANITWIPAGATLEQVIAFDTGPGNCVSDHLARKHAPAGPGYDENGARAMRGTINVEVAKRVLSSRYFRKPYPKSTDGPEMIALFEDALEHHPLAVDDQFATAASITTSSIMAAIKELGAADHILASGGGVRNQFILQQLANAPAPADLVNDSDAKEALAFALLAAATLDGEPSNVPSVTGAKRAVVLGSITPKP
jgi:anhydro-N-acetylmuramic acid kinase